mmetsp:Transcript_50749/g.135337  ORF Transcript_50749/g.135337 Transcript_50749/m.135337 type:complete len:280 (-) Transcript_50749:547-1386(-)
MLVHDSKMKCDPARATCSTAISHTSLWSREGSFESACSAQRLAALSIGEVSTRSRRPGRLLSVVSIDDVDGEEPREPDPLVAEWEGSPLSAENLSVWETAVRSYVNVAPLASSCEGSTTESSRRPCPDRLTPPSTRVSLPAAAIIPKASMPMSVRSSSPEYSPASDHATPSPRFMDSTSTSSFCLSSATTTASETSPLSSRRFNDRIRLGNLPQEHALTSRATLLESASEVPKHSKFLLVPPKSRTTPRKQTRQSASLLGPALLPCNSDWRRSVAVAIR